MDNLTHSFIGLAAAKAGLERLSPGTTAVCLLSTNAPDADILSLLFGDRWTYLHYHRGITHSIAGTLVLSLLIPLAFFAGDRLRSRVRKRAPAVKLRGLILASLVVGASHPFMDWTNNYGIRPLLPWNPKWFYGDLVFIVDPFIWLLVGGATFLLLSKTKTQIAFWIVLASMLTFLVLFAANRQPMAGLGWVRAVWVASLLVLAAMRIKMVNRWEEKVAITSLGLLFIYWSCLGLIHRYVLYQARLESVSVASTYNENVLDVAAMPMLANPFRWQVVIETEKAAYRTDISLLNAERSDLIRHPRPEAMESELVSQALQDRRAKVFLEFARFPVTRIVGADCTTQTLVQLADLRYTEPGSQRGTFALEIPVECDATSPSNQR